MSEFYAVLTGPEGCDHSISCGTKVVPLSAGNWEQAKERAHEQYDYHGGEEMVSSVQVLEVASRETMDIAAWKQERIDAAAAREVAKDRAEFERLAKKLNISLDGAVAAAAASAADDAADHLRAVVSATRRGAQRG